MGIKKTQERNARSNRIPSMPHDGRCFKSAEPPNALPPPCPIPHSQCPIQANS
ncbi:MAG: hypothetical protein KME31_20960 [Tolypothrix carrinoi HA7290-LM1]|nr:hypothetical protein [Tolypothrix carrinoi HA7290-LM1]